MHRNEHCGQTIRERVMLSLMALEVFTMAAVSVRDLDDEVKDRLRVRAAANGRSMEAEIRAILVDAVNDTKESVGLLAALEDRFGALGGAELDLPPRATPPRAASFTP
ncbi:MAG: Arc family DNA-binding protein [Micrococcales bacterium]|nr:Arc family DNA-binding protein [Micrococcales bacterium]